MILMIMIIAIIDCFLGLIISVAYNTINGPIKNDNPKHLFKYSKN